MSRGLCVGEHTYVARLKGREGGEEVCFVILENVVGWPHLHDGGLGLDGDSDLLRDVRCFLGGLLLQSRKHRCAQVCAC